MVKSLELDRVFGALSHPARRAMLARLARGEASVSELGAPLAMSMPAVTKHLHVLEDAGLIRREVDGRVHRLQLTADPLKDAAFWMQTYVRFWGEQFDALDAFLKRTAPTGGHKPARTRRPGRKRKKED